MTHSTFILVHGGWHGGWCYERVATLLRARGHIVFTPTLTGLGERAHLFSGSINLSTHIDDVLSVVMFERLDSFVLVGHAYGGMVVTGVADRIPEHVKALVYLDAFVPEDGESLADISLDGIEGFIMAAGANGGLAIPPPDASFFGVFGEDAEMVNTLTTPHPLGTLTEKVTLSGAHHAVDPVLYVHATELKRESPFVVFYERAKEAGWTVAELACGHDVMLDMPVETAELIEVARIMANGGVARFAAE